jgi:hypothetical protein
MRQNKKSTDGRQNNKGEWRQGRSLAKWTWPQVEEEVEEGRRMKGMDKMREEGLYAN